ncbi:hypothetical protein D8674_023169 [Pyrus ussuriensis x Pyrus communis]|uniref:Reverse transcriptase domain-containing protein n=1 Tax=Pyrus ussuriensis x Pyrus communis TaxID=2448454 RepID=A0A5N5GRS2_9ROSA|nr:hypothetical protein D8674_023169 [Pyrus ussuriensis x Pyrus communis]
MMGDPLGSSRVSSQKQNPEGVVGAQSGQYRAMVESSPGCGGGSGGWIVTSHVDPVNHVCIFIFLEVVFGGWGVMGKLPRGRFDLNCDMDWLIVAVQLGGLFQQGWHIRVHYGRLVTFMRILLMSCYFDRVDKRVPCDSDWASSKVGFQPNGEQGVEELVVQLNQTLKISSMEQGIKLVGKVLTQKPVNKWGVRNILRAAWQELGEVEIKWVRENVFVISAKDENVASKIIEQVPWAVMKKVFSVVKWPPELALEELELDAVPFWVQIRGIPLGLASAGKFIAMEDPGLARGFLRVRILVDTEKPLFKGCWIRRDTNRDTWVEFRYERLQDFCYRCGRIGHNNTECTVEVTREGAVAYGEWLKAPPVRDVVAVTRVECVGRGERRQAGGAQTGQRGYSESQQHTELSRGGGTSTIQSTGPKKWRRRRRTEGEDSSSSSSMERTKPRGEGHAENNQGVNEVLSAQGEDPMWGIKRGVESQEVLLTSVSQKKPRGPDMEEKCQGRVECAVSTPEANKEEISEHQARKELSAGGSDTARSDTTVRALHGLIRNRRPSMIFLSETKMKDHRICGVRRRLGYSNGFNVSPIGRSGGLSLWWEDNLEVKIIYSSKHIIDAVMKGKGQTHWCRLTGVYGTPYRNEESVFWDWMGNHFIPTDIPWICGGDFIEYIWDHKKSGGVEVLYNRPRFLEEFMSSSQLLDLGFHGSAFIWKGLRRGEWVEERLDRVLANERWQECWPNSHVVHGMDLASDHCPIILNSSLEGPKGRNLFRFEAYWAMEEECKELVKICWEGRQHGSPVNRWVRKINDCRSRLSRWNHSKFKGRSYKIQELLSYYWCQRSRVKWLREGDANTKFFHSSTLQRRRRNKVVKLRNKNGSWVDHPSQVRQLVENHFTSVFCSAGDRDWGAMLDCLTPSVTSEMNAALIAPVTEEEIKEAAMQMGGLKAPGPDGFQGIFYHTYWEIVREDIFALVRDLLQESAGTGHLNQTHIVLIPKVPNPEYVSQFRPISLCNYSYKILSKILANRLKVLLPTIISPSQNAFVAGRQIQDSIGIAHEMFHFLKGRKARNKFEMGIKLDMQKAYDRVEWDFLDAVMERMGFCNRWRSLISGCLSSVQFAVLLNGQAGAPFVPSRGIRQGDPLSPYLFILVGEVLSKMIQGAVDQGRLEGVKMGGSGPVISHLFFADDTLLFLRADQKNCRNLRHLIESFCVASGQKVNLMKSSVFFGVNVPMGIADQLGRSFGMVVVNNPGTYLGVPAIWGRSKIMEKLQGWKQSSLSRASKEVLIKAVIQAIPAYPMSIFKFPKVGCKEGAHKIHWVSNEVIKARYFPHCSIWDAKKGGRASWAWSSLLCGRDLIREGSHWQIMGGQEVRVWQDRWLPSLPLGHPVPFGPVAVTPGLRVSDLICPESGRWNLGFLQPIISGEDMQAIEETPLGDLSRKDWLIWEFNKNECYSVKSGYRWLQDRSLELRDTCRPSVRGVPRSLWKGIWKLEVPPKLRHFLWLTVHGCLPTRDALFRQRSSQTSTYPICCCHDETTEHMFLSCSWVEPIWFGGALGYKVDRLSLPDWVDWFQAVFSPNMCTTGDTKWQRSYIVFTCWCIWKARCDFVFNGVPLCPPKVLAAITMAVSSFFGAKAAAGCRNVGYGRKENQAVRWCAPVNPFVKINVDASWSKASKLGFAGVIARGQDRRMVAAARYAIRAPSAAAAEATTLMHGCQLGAALGLRYVILESDSLEAIKCLSSSLSVGSWEAFPMLARVKQMGRDFLDCRWSWVPRLANCVAHELASVDFPEMCDVVWVERPPSSLVFVLNNDGLPCPH